MRPDFQSAGHAKYFQYRAAVDGLRGIAVLAVLGFHAFPNVVPGGYVGVDVFFVVSGFLITSIIARQVRNDAFSFADFYWRRVRRLFPALILVLLATLALGWLVLLPDEFMRLGKHVAAAAAFVANIAFWRERGYFDVAAEFKPLLHLWSLGIEEQFYLVWPVLLVSLWKRRVLLFGVLSVLVIASFALSVMLSHSAPDANFYSPFSRFWELGAGCILALLYEYPVGARAGKHAIDPDRHGALCTALPLLGAALIAASIALLDDSTKFPGWAALLPVLGTLLILLAPEQAWFQRRVLGSRLLVSIGLISYALYLWHWPLLAFANIVEAGAPQPAIRWIALALSFLLAWATYRFVEIPARRRRQLKFNIGLAAAVVVAGFAGIAVYAVGGVVQRFDTDVQALRHGPRLDPQCLARFSEDDRINYCRTTSPEPPTIVVVGDSRAQAVYEGAAPLFAPQHSVMLLGRGGCPPLLNVRIRGYDLNEKDCEGIWQTFVRYIRAAQPKVVVIVGNGSSLITDRDVQLTRSGATTLESKEAVYEYGIRSLMTAIKQTSRVIHLSEIPGFDSAPSCFLRGVRLPTTRCVPEVERSEVENAMASYNRVLSRVRAAFPDVQFVDTLDVLCAEKTCSQWPQDKPILYSDAIHLSPAGGRLLVEHAELPRLISRGIRTAEAGVRSP